MASDFSTGLATRSSSRELAGGVAPSGPERAPAPGIAVLLLRPLQPRHRPSRLISAALARDRGACRKRRGRPCAAPMPVADPRLRERRGCCFRRPPGVLGLLQVAERSRREESLADSRKANGSACAHSTRHLLSPRVLLATALDGTGIRARLLGKSCVFG